MKLTPRRTELFFSLPELEKEFVMVKPTLLVLAAGMGSRYGSLKQMESAPAAKQSLTIRSMMLFVPVLAKSYL